MPTRKQRTKRKAPIAKRDVASGSWQYVPASGKAAKSQTETKPQQDRVLKNIDYNEPIPQLSNWQLFRPNLTLLRRNFESTIFIILLPALVIQFGRILTGNGHTLTQGAIVGLVLIAVGFIWTAVNFSVTYYFMARAIRGDQPTVSECYRKGLRYWFRLLGLMMLTSVIILGGLICFIIPGFIAIRRYLLAPFFMVDYDCGIREAMSLSSAATKPVSSSVYGLLIVLAILTVCSFTLVTIPVFGGAISNFFALLYIFFPALRYMEIGHQQSALSIKD